ncbi:MAG: Matrixin [Pedosphaera sp.]|nr:Matrixin [Pedosphaera sp.]
MRSLLLALVVTGCSLSPLSAAESAFVFADFLVVPVRIHLLSAKEVPALHTTLVEADIQRILGKVNKVWAAAGIHFSLESVQREEAARQDLYDKEVAKTDLAWVKRHYSEKPRITNAFNVYYIKQFGVNGVYFPEAIFVKDTASLRKVENGLDEPLPRVTSHELGHALSLPHRQNVTNLMASGTSGFALSADEIQRARAAAGNFRWIKPAGTLFAEAGRHFDQGQKAEALKIYQSLALLPLDSPELTQVRQRLKAGAGR